MVGMLLKHGLHGMFVMSAACREVAVQADVRELLPALIAAVCHSN